MLRWRLRSRPGLGRLGLSGHAYAWVRAIQACDPTSRKLTDLVMIYKWPIWSFCGVFMDHFLTRLLS